MKCIAISILSFLICGAHAAEPAPSLSPPASSAAAPTGAVNPIEAAFFDVPYRAFAKMILTLQEAFDAE